MPGILMGVEVMTSCQWWAVWEAAAQERMWGFAASHAAVMGWEEGVGEEGERCRARKTLVG